jgi:hypothetical protein
MERVSGIAILFVTVSMGGDHRPDHGAERREEEQRLDGVAEVGEDHGGGLPAIHAPRNGAPVASVRHDWGVPRLAVLATLAL